MLDRLVRGPLLKFGHLGGKQGQNETPPPPDVELPTEFSTVAWFFIVIYNLIMPIMDIPLQDIQVLQQVHLFQGLHPGDLAMIVRVARHRQVERGFFFFLEGDPATHLYILTHGQVKLAQLTPEGQQVILRFACPGEMFGGIAVLGVPEYPVSAEAVDDCRALAWDGETMAQLMEQCPRLAMNALHLLAKRVQELQDRLREMTTERVERRVARTLLRLIRQVGRKVEGGVLIDLPLSRQDLAELTGTTLYTVSRILSRWEQEGLIESGRARVLVRHPHGLVTIAEDLPLDHSSEGQL